MDSISLNTPQVLCLLTVNPKNEHSGSYRTIVKKTWPLLLFNAAVSLVISAEYINLIVISNMIWPGEPFHALQLGAMITARLWIDGIMALFWGYLADRYNRKKIFSINCGMTGFFVILNGLASIGGGNSDYLVWMIIRGCIGIFMSGGGPNIQSLSSDLRSKDERSQFFGLTSIVWTVVQVIAMVVSAFLFQLDLWRAYFYVVGAIYLFLGGYLIMKFQEPKRGIQEHALSKVLADQSTEYRYILNKQTVRDTVFSRTNLLVFAEGIFSCLFFGVLDLVLLPYIQSPPRNISPGNTAIFMLIFGIPGALIGSIVLAKISDQWGKKDIKNRITLIIISLASAYLIVMGLFLIPLPELTTDEGNTFLVIFEYPIFFWLGLIIFTSRLSIGLFSINQPAVILEINLPEAQGTIRSWGQLVEIVSYGAGPLIAGLMLETMDQNYVGVMLRMFIICLPGLFMWVFTYRTVLADRQRIQDILITRSDELALKKTPPN